MILHDEESKNDAEKLVKKSDVMTLWHDVESTEKPEGYVLVAVSDDYGINVHIAKWIARYAEEQHGDFAGCEDYCEVSGCYYKPEGWYQQATLEENYDNELISYSVIAWALLPEYK